MTGDATGAGRGPDLRNVRVLLLEDDFYLATDAQTQLERCGAAVAGPFADAGEAVRAVAEQRPDCALLDINVGAGPSFAVADRLAELGVPFAFLTGYDPGVVPDRHRHVPRDEKPAGPATLPRVVADLAERACGA